jgi:PAS domain S-box-containing protein
VSAVTDLEMGDEQQLALLVSSAIDYAMFMLDPRGYVRSWNAGAQRLKGYTRDEIVGRHFSTFYTAADRAREHPAHELEIATREGRYQEEGWRVRKDGSQFWANVTITAIRDADGRLVGFGKVSQDLTARRLRDERARARAAELEAANERLAEYQRLVSSVRDYAIFMLDPGGHILSWNAGAQYLKGYRPEEIIGRHFSTFYTAADRARDHPAHELEIATREGRYEEEGWRIRKDGSRFWASVTITAVRDEGGRLTGFAKVTRDLTERKAGEDALRQAVERLRRSNAELDRFASVAAHDMMDPLRTISGFAEVIVETDPAPGEQREYAQHILESGLRLSGMLQGLLAYARAGTLPTGSETAVVADVIDQVRDDLASTIAERTAQVTADVPQEAVVGTNGHDLRALLQNLISNALKFGDPSTPTARITARREDAGWRIAVEDNGQGIAAEDQATIFDAYGRAAGSSRQSGYGLGLAICQRLVERRGGQIGVESAPGRGSRFWFTLPAPVAGEPAHEGLEDAPVPLS